MSRYPITSPWGERSLWTRHLVEESLAQSPARERESERTTVRDEADVSARGTTEEEATAKTRQLGLGGIDG